MSKEAYVPQSYPLFVALDRIELPGSIRELDIYDVRRQSEMPLIGGS